MKAMLLTALVAVLAFDAGIFAMALLTQAFIA